VRGGRPVIRGTGIAVDLIASFFKAGESVEDILLYYPQFKSAQVYDAISYYLDHQAEIDKYLELNRIDHVLKEFDLKMDEFGIIRPRCRTKVEFKWNKGGEIENVEFQTSDGGLRRRNDELYNDEQ